MNEKQKRDAAQLVHKGQNRGQPSASLANCLCARFEPGLKEREEGEKSKSNEGTLSQTANTLSRVFSFGT